MLPERNSQQPTQVGTPGLTMQLDAAKHGRYLYSVDVFKGLLVFDVSDPSRPKQLGSGDFLEGVNELEIAGDSLFVLTDSEGIQIHDLSQPTDLSPAATLDDPGYGLAIDILGTLAVVVRGDGLQVLDLSDPLAPMILYDEQSPG